MYRIKKVFLAISRIKTASSHYFSSGILKKRAKNLGNRMLQLYSRTPRKNHWWGSMAPCARTTSLLFNSSNFLVTNRAQLFKSWLCKDGDIFNSSLETEGKTRCNLFMFFIELYNFEFGHLKMLLLLLLFFFFIPSPPPSFPPPLAPLPRWFFKRNRHIDGHITNFLNLPFFTTAERRH